MSTFFSKPNLKITPAINEWSMVAYFDANDIGNKVKRNQSERTNNKSKLTTIITEGESDVEDPRFLSI